MWSTPGLIRGGSQGAHRQQQEACEAQPSRQGGVHQQQAGAQASSAAQGTPAHQAAAQWDIECTAHSVQLLLTHGPSSILLQTRTLNSTGLQIMLAASKTHVCVPCCCCAAECFGPVHGCTPRASRRPMSLLVQILPICAIAQPARLHHTQGKQTLLATHSASMTLGPGHLW
jgi:hypothetical protein